MVIFETIRLIVRRYTMEDVEHFFLLNGNPEVVKYIRPPVSKKEAYSFLEKIIYDYEVFPDFGRLAVIEKETGAYAGTFALIPLVLIDDAVQIGYSLLPDKWGKGYATELVTYGIPYFFQHSNSAILYAVAEEQNLASQKVLIKCGFVNDMDYKEGNRTLVRFKLNKQTQLV